MGFEKALRAGIEPKAYLIFGGRRDGVMKAAVKL